MFHQFTEHVSSPPALPADPVLSRCIRATAQGIRRSCHCSSPYVLPLCALTRTSGVPSIYDGQKISRRRHRRRRSAVQIAASCRWPDSDITWDLERRIKVIVNITGVARHPIVAPKHWCPTTVAAPRDVVVTPPRQTGGLYLGIKSTGVWTSNTRNIHPITPPINDVRKSERRTAIVWVIMSFNIVTNESMV